MFALTIFLGAFLVFQVQPLIAKYILPWFGGGPGVWTTCMLFFQVLLLGGYAYAHLLTRWLRPRKQVIVHLSLLVASLVLLPITPSDSWKPSGVENPVWRILALLTATLGLPYFVLAATGPLIQRWFTLAQPGRSPYRLYALSNIGSLLALLSYPLVFENYFTRKLQAGLWGWGLIAFFVVCLLCARSVWKTEGKEPRSQEQTPHEPSVRPATDETKTTQGPGGPPIDAVGPQGVLHPARRGAVPIPVLWMLLPACASVLLLATTNKICQDVAVIPFLWVLPLSLYLLSFIICFDSPRWYRRVPFGVAFFAGLLWLCWALPMGKEPRLFFLIGGYSACLFVGCMLCHGEVYRLKPEPQRLTGFYLMIAAGGALGGFLVAVVAPLVFNAFHELPLGFLACGLLWLLTWARTIESGPSQPGAFSRSLKTPLLTPTSVAVLTLAAVAVVMWLQTHRFTSSVVQQTRNFYGVLTVREEFKDKAIGHHFVLHHGNTLHGLQFVDPVGAQMPTVYYAPQSGIGRMIIGMLSHSPAGRRYGIVGLGVGTLAAYARTNDYFRFYEINPAVMHVATKFFTYAPHCAAKVDCVIGDARLSLEKETAQNFDLLVLDAFSGDSIPVHLLTREAFGVYARHLKPGGVIAVHTSNNYLDLEPLLVSLAQTLGYSLAVVEAHPAPKEWWVRPTIWVLLSRDARALNLPEVRSAARVAKAVPGHVRYWTDDFTSLYQVLR